MPPSRPGTLLSNRGARSAGTIIPPPSVASLYALLTRDIVPAGDEEDFYIFQTNSSVGDDVLLSQDNI